MSQRVKLVVFIVLAFMAWYVLLSRGRPVHKNAYVDRENDFSVLPPENWILVTKNNLKEASHQPALYLPADIQQEMASGKIALGFLQKARQGKVTPSIYVVIVQERFPKLNKRDMQAFASLLEKSAANIFGTYQKESVRLIKVDAIQSLRVSGSLASAHHMAPPQKPLQGEPIRLEIVFVRGAQQAYLITFICPLQELDRHSKTFEKLLDSFRVLRRPSFF